MKLGYELTIEQSQKLVMTPELIQAIQILQFNTQELESFVEEQVLTNPILETESMSETPIETKETIIETPEVEEKPAQKEEDFDWAEYFKERQYDDISYRQSEYSKDGEEYTYDQFTSAHCGAEY